MKVLLTLKKVPNKSQGVEIVPNDSGPTLNNTGKHEIQHMLTINSHKCCHDQVGGEAEAESALDDLHRLVSTLRSELEREKHTSKDLQVPVDIHGGMITQCKCN